MFRRIALMVLGVGSMLWMSGCTVHPSGERQERALARKEGEPFQLPATQRSQPPLPDQPTADDLVRYALLTSPQVEQRYWDWRAAIEQIPQDGTQATNLAFTGGTSLSHGKASLDRTTATLGNDPMADIVWPSKLSAAAQRALENARAAGERFQRAKLDLRQKVLEACYDYALTSEQIRLETAGTELLKTAAGAIDARATTGAATQQDVLKARNEVDLSSNDISNMRSQQIGQRAALCALLSWPPETPLKIPGQMPVLRPLDWSDDQIIAIAAEKNPELRALAMEVRGQREGLRLAQLQYIPDISLAAGSDLAGMMQSLSGMATVPVLRHEAIEASIAQANARLNAADALVRQSKNDLAARLFLDIAVVHDADRQLALFQSTIIPRAGQIVTLSQTGYETGQSSLSDLVESRRSLLAFQKVQADLRITREKHLIDIETAGLLAPITPSRGRSHSASTVASG